MVAGVIPVRAVGPARRDAQNPYSSDLGGSSSVDGCLLLTRDMRQVYVDAGDIRCRCPAFAAGAGCRHRRALAETMRSELAEQGQRHVHAHTYAEVVGSPTKALPALPADICTFRYSDGRHAGRLHRASR